MEETAVAIVGAGLAGLCCARQLVEAGVPDELAVSIAGLEPMTAALDIVDVAQGAGVKNAAAAWIYSALNETLELDWVSHQLAELAVHTHWHLLARTKLQAGLMGHRRNLTAQVLKGQSGSETPAELLACWVDANTQMLDRHAQMIAEFKAGNVFDFAIMSLVVAGVGELLPTTFTGEHN